MKHNRFLSLLILIILGAFIFFNFSVGSDSTTDSDIPNAHEVHKWLAEGKIRAFEQMQEALKKSQNDYISTTQTEYDVKFYDISIRVNDTIAQLDGVVKIVAEATTDNVQFIDIDFQDYYLLFVDSIVHPIAGVLSYIRNDDITTVELPQAINENEQFEFTFYYHGTPYGFDHAFTWYFINNEEVVYSSSEPYYARFWWPCKDRPDDKADSFYIAIMVDTSYYVGSNGSLDSIIGTGDLDTIITFDNRVWDTTYVYLGNAHTFYYTEKYPMVTYLFSIAISDYEVWYDEWVYNDGQDTMPIVNAIFPQDYHYSLTTLDVTPEILDVLSECYGQYPFADEKYGHACWYVPGAMEHQTMTSTTPEYGGWGFSVPVVTHEAAHQWFGNYITCENWHHIWINEGFASYSEALYYYKTKGWTAYRVYMSSMLYKGGGTVYCEDTTNASSIFNVGLSYDKGAWVVHMLRWVLEDSLFFAALDAIYNSELAHNSATTEELRDVIEVATGVELDWFFEQWIYGLYYPKFTYSVWMEESDSTGYDYFISIEQTQQTRPELFITPIQFTLSDSAYYFIDTARFWMDQEYDVFRYNLPEEKFIYELDPYGWLIKDEKKVPWTIHILTPEKELKSGVKGEPYSDIIEYRSIEPVTEALIVIDSLPKGLTLDTDGNLTGVPAESGLFEFVVRYLTETGTRSESLTYTMFVEHRDYLAGDIDLNGALDVADIIYMVDFMFNEGEPIMLNEVADVDNNCVIDIGDLVYLVDFQFTSGPPPIMGCAK